MGFVTVEETRHKQASSTNLKGIKNISVDNLKHLN